MRSPETEEALTLWFKLGAYIRTIPGATSSSLLL